jgi:hypothetical protein
MRCHIIKQLVVVHIPRHSVPFPEYDLSTVSAAATAKKKKKNVSGTAL